MNRITILFALAALSLAGCESSPDAEAETDAPPSPPPIAADRTVVYDTGAGGPMRMDVYAPKDKKGPFPAVLLIHGGGWMGGSRTEMGGIGKIFAEEGLVALSIDYRLAPRFPWPAQREDVRAAVRFVRKNAIELNVLSDRIGSAGVSAGGHLSAILGSPAADGKTDARVQAVGSISGIHDLNLPLTVPGERYRIVETLLKEDGRRDMEARDEASPIKYVDKTSAPTLFVCGGKDPLVPRDQSEEMMKRLRAAGVEAEIIDVPAMEHVPDVDVPEQAEAMRRLAKWMKKRLGG